MATSLKKQFLDYTGLQQFWGIIDAKFANKVDAAKVGSFTFDTTAASVTMKYTDSAVSPKTYDIALPMASKDNAGMLSASDKSLIDDIDNKINDMAPFHGLKIDGKEIYLPGKRGNIGLNFRTGGSVEDGTRTAHIELVDLAYQATYGNKTWKEITAGEYDANKVNHLAYENKYYEWSDPTQAGPVNNVNAPLMELPISSIDVSELVKAGLLNDADVVYRSASEGVAEGMYLKLTFITDGAGTTTKDVYINVTDLVDIYSEGEGIEIANDAMNSDEGIGTGSSRTGTIKVRVATADTLGAVRVGYTTDNTKQLYKVELDANGNAFVAVPWEHTSVNVTTEDANSAGEKYLVVTQNHNLSKVDANGIPTPEYSFNIEVGAGVKNAEALAGTSVQSVTVGAVSEEEGAVGVSKDAYIKVSTEQMTRNVDDKTINAGTKVVAELTDSAKASLGLADTAVQKVSTSNVDRGDDSHTPTGADLVVSLVNNTGADYGTEKGEKTIKVTLGEKTTASLDKADTAMQTVTIMGTTLNIDDPVYETHEAVKALSLGSAANVNTTTSIPEGVIGTEDGQLKDEDFKEEVEKPDGTKEARYTVATTKAVKVYVDSENAKQSEELRNFTTAAINDLDSSVSVSSSTVDEVAYGDAYGEGVTAHQVMIGVTQTDGKLTAAAPYILGIADIADFAPLSETDINTICGITA
jgi:hypothetical protein